MKFLAKLFIKDCENTDSPKVRAAYGTLASVVGILANFVLVFLKMLSGILSGSVAILADAFNNLSDAGSSAISLISFKISARPPDRDHPHGHARMEYVTSIVVAMIVIVLGFELLKGSFESLLSPDGTASVAPFTLIILLVAILGKLLLGLFYFAVAKKIDSDVLKASGIDSLSDVLSTAAVFIGVILQLFFPQLWISAYVDGAIGLLVSLLIILAGLKILNETKNRILGEQPPAEQVEAVKACVKAYPECLGIHDLVMHEYGPGHTVASLHVEVDGSRNMFEIHDAIDNMEREIEERLGIICTIHTDPIALDADTTDVKAKMEAGLFAIDPRLSLHDFRMVHGVTHSNLVFDVSVPFEVELSPEELRRRVLAEAKKLDPSYETVIHIDRV